MGEIPSGGPDDIVPDWSLESQEQAAALVNAVNNGLSHYPTQPANMELGLYELGSKGASSSNLYAGDSTLYSNVLGYMSDTDSSNIDRVGHRRWIINPTMKKTMFGFINNEEGYPYGSMYAFNREGAAFQYDYISWPSAGYFPAEIFNTYDAWSVSL